MTKSTDFRDLSAEIESYYDVFSEPLRNGSTQRSFGYGNTQWSAEDITTLKKMKMPNVRQNIISKHIKSAVAEFASNVPALEVKGKKGASERAVKTYEALIEEILKDGKSALVEAYENLLRTGMSGGLYVYNEYEDENGGFKQRIKIDPIGFENFYFDPSATTLTKHDGNFMGYLTRMTKKVYKEKFPKAKPIGYDSEKGLVNDSWIMSPQENEIVVAHHFRKVRDKPHLQYLTASGLVLNEGDDLPEGEEIIQEREVTPTRIKMYKLSGMEILEEEELEINQFPIIACQGYSTIISGKYYPISYGYELQGLQRFQNIMLTQLCASVLYLRKNTTLWDASTLSEETMAVLKNPMAPANVVMDLSDPNKRPVRWQSEELSQTLMGMYRENMDQIDHTLGRSQATQGASTPQISSQTQAMQISQGNLPIYFYLHPMLMAIDRLGDILKEMIPQVYVTPDEIISGKESYSINDRENAEGLNFNDEEFDVNAYHISIRVGASFAIQKERTLQLMMELYKAAPDQMKALMAPMMMEAMEIPNLPALLDVFNKFLAFSNPQLFELMQNDNMDEIIQMGQQNQAKQNQTQQAVQGQVQAEAQMKLKEQQQKIAIQQAELELKHEELELKKAKQQMEQLESASKYQLAMEEMDEKAQSNMAKVEAEITKAQAEVEKARLDLAKGIASL